MEERKIRPVLDQGFAGKRIVICLDGTWNKVADAIRDLRANGRPRPSASAWRLYEPAPRLPGQAGSDPS